MIKLQSVHIEEVRGIRKLDLNFGQKTFAISGPNGSGKSGVIDAIEFGLTGQIGRLTGRGTQGLSVAEHGPHVDKIKFPDAPFVTLRVFLTHIGKTATITRQVTSPNKPKIEPPDPDVKAVLAEVADHPEITLSRRDILRFILVEPTKRSEEIQTILKLETIGQTRSVLNTAQNRLQITLKTTNAQVESARSALTLHFQIATLQSADLLEVVNKRRMLLGLSAIVDLFADTKLDSGLSGATKPSDFNKDSVLRDLKAFAEVAKEFWALGKAEATVLNTELEKLDGDPALLAALQRRSFIEKGIEFIEGPQCPLCDTPWDNEQHLREHLKAKLSKSEEARQIQDTLLKNATTLIEKITRINGVLTPVQKIAATHEDAPFTQSLSSWKSDLEALQDQIVTIDGVRKQKDRFAGDWLNVPNAFAKSLAALTQKIEAQPDQTATFAAQTFLTTAQLRLTDYREAMRKGKAGSLR